MTFLGSEDILSGSHNFTGLRVFQVGVTIGFVLRFGLWVYLWRLWLGKEYLFCVWFFGYRNCSYLANMRLQFKNPSATVWFHISDRGPLSRSPAWFGILCDMLPSSVHVG